MTAWNTLPAAAPSGFVPERRSEPREPITGTLWMIDHYGSTVLKCECIEASPNGLRLRVPLGYGVAEGQRYELRSHLPGRGPMRGFDLIGSRWATVVRTQVRLGGDEDHLDVGVVLDDVDSTSLTISATTALV
jgi:hypothetical protein